MIFTFGKHKGKEVSEVWQIDQNYIKWCISHMNGFSLQTEMVSKITGNVLSDFSISEDLAKVLTTSTIGKKLLEYNGKQICGPVIQLRLPETEGHDPMMISYKESKKSNKWVVAKVGKVITKLSNDNLFNFTQRDVEEFSNSYKAINYMKNVEFQIVSGIDLKKFYLEDNYDKSGGGTLNNSCMKHSNCQPFLKIYYKNKDDVSMLIVKNKNSDKILGRAIIWNKTTIKSANRLFENIKFMDRIYYCNDFQINLFVEYAKMNDIAFKEAQNNEVFGVVNYKGERLANPIIKAKIKEWDFDKYPYLDTLTFLWKDGYCSNVEPWARGGFETKRGVECASLRSTGGDRGRFYDYAY